MKRGVHHTSLVEQFDADRREAEANAYAVGRWAERALFGPAPMPAPCEFVREVMARDVRLVAFRVLWDEMTAAMTADTNTVTREGIPS